MVKKERLITSINVYDDVYVIVLTYDDENAFNIRGIKEIKDIDQLVITKHNFKRIGDLESSANCFGIGIEYMLEDDWNKIEKDKEK